MSELTAHIDMPLGVHAPRSARAAVSAVLSGWGYRDDGWLELAAVVVSELVTNAVRHGGGCIGLDIEAHAGRVIIAVADGSSVVPRRRDPDQAGGRGLALIEGMSARWGVHDHEGGKRVWVQLNECPGLPSGDTGRDRGGPR